MVWDKEEAGVSGAEGTAEHRDEGRKQARLARFYRP